MSRASSHARAALFNALAGPRASPRIRRTFRETLAALPALRTDEGRGVPAISRPTL